MMPISDGRVLETGCQCVWEGHPGSSYTSPVLKAASRLWQHVDYFSLDHAMICARTERVTLSCLQLGIVE